jgi:hypothetical protein
MTASMRFWLALGCLAFAGFLAVSDKAGVGWFVIAGLLVAL